MTPEILRNWSHLIHTRVPTNSRTFIRVLRSVGFKISAKGCLATPFVAQENDPEGADQGVARDQSRRSLCHSKVRRNRTGAPGSPTCPGLPWERTWAENDGAQAHD